MPPRVMHRVRVYASDGVTVLTPAAGASHSEAFRVASAAGVTGYQPYLKETNSWPTVSFDRKTAVSQIGTFLVRVQDVAEWVTAFAGDSRARDQFRGMLLVREISTDAGANWAAEAGGRILSARAPDPHVSGGGEWEFTVREDRVMQKRRVFTGVPHHTVTYAYPAPLYPPALLHGVQEFGPNWYKKESPVRGTIKAVTQTGKRAIDALGSTLGGIIPHFGHQVTAALAASADYRDYRGASEFCPHVRVRLTRLDTNATGDFYLAPVGGGLGVTYDGSGLDYSPIRITPKRGYACRFGITEMHADHPQYMALPPAGTSVEFHLFHAGPPRPDAPLLIDDVHPATLWADLLDGKFSMLWDRDGRMGAADPEHDGSVAERPIRYDSTAMTALAADGTFPELRFLIDRGWKLEEFVSQQIAQTSHIVGIAQPDGSVAPKDVRLTNTSATGAVTLTGADVVECHWEDPEDAASLVTVVSYVDRWGGPTNPDELFPSYSPVVATPQRIPFAAEKLKDILVPQPLVIDALGIRAHGGDTGYSIGNKERVVAEPYLQLFGAGASMVDLLALRGGTADGVEPGDWFLVDLDSVPNRSSNTRGGTQIFLCTSRGVQGMAHWRMRAIHAGPDSAAIAPTLASLTKSVDSPTDTVTIDVTLNAAGDQVVLEFAVTETSEGTRPAASSSLWRHREDVVATGTVTVPRLPSGRVWARARSVAPNQQPSGYAYPTPGYVDLDVYPVARNLSLAQNDDGSVTATWENDTAAGVRLHYAAHAADADPTLAAYVDVDADDETYEFTSDLVTAASFTVGLTPYSAYSASTCSGTAGTQLLRTLQALTEVSELYEILAVQDAHTDATGDTVTHRVVAAPAVRYLLLWTASQAQGAAEPWSTMETTVPTQLTLTGAVATSTLTVPDEGSLLYWRYRAVTIVGGRVILSDAWDGVLSPRPVQTPAYLHAMAEHDDDTATAWLRIINRGIAVSSVTFTRWSKWYGFNEYVPTASEGDTSEAYGGTLAAGEYEYTFDLDQWDMTRIFAEVLLENGSTISVAWPGVNKGRTPDFVSAPHGDDAPLVRVVGDSDTICCSLERTDGTTWKRYVDANEGTFDVTVADHSSNAGQSTDTTVPYRATLYSDPRADIDGSTLTATRDFTVTLGTPGAAAASWSVDPEVAVPTIDTPADDEITVSLHATAAPAGSYVKLMYRHQYAGGGWSALTDIAGSVSPALSAPPTSLTSYTYATGYGRVAKSAPLPPSAAIELTAEIYDSGDVLLDAHGPMPATWYVTEEA